MDAFLYTLSFIFFGIAIYSLINQHQKTKTAKSQLPDDYISIDEIELNRENIGLNIKKGNNKFCFYGDGSVAFISDGYTPKLCYIVNISFAPNTYSETTVHRSSGNAIIGGVLFGPLGAAAGAIFSKERVETKYYEGDTKIYLTLLKKQDILDLESSRERVKKRVISNVSTTGNTKYAEKLISKYCRDFDYVFDMVRAEQALPSKKDNFLKSISEPKPTPRFQIHKYDLVKLIDGRLAIVFSINDANTEYEVRIKKSSESWKIITIKHIDIAHVYQHLDSFLSPTKISLSIKDVFFKYDVNFLIEKFPDINVEALCTDSEWFDLENKLEGLLLKYSQISNKQSHNIGIRIQRMLDIIPEKYVDVSLSSVVPPTLEEIDQLEELDVVKLKDGKFATIVFAPPHPYSWDMRFDFDIGDSSTSWATPITEIAEIIFFHSKNLPIHLNKMLTKEAIQNLHVLVPDFDVNKTLSKEELTKLYDLIDHKLMTQGFDTNDEPTPIGLMAENLLTEFADI